MNRIAEVAAGVVLLLALAFAARAEVGAGVKVGTLGLGADVTVGLNEVLNARAGINKFELNLEASESEITGTSDELSAQLSLLTVPVLLDWHPFHGGFRLSGGIVFNSNEITASADPGDTIEFDDQDFTVTSVDGDVDFDSVAPYVGIGFGNAVTEDGSWNFVFDLGVMFHGEPQITLTAVAADPALQPALDEAVEAERSDWQEDADSFQFYPVLAFGISYKF